jgi:hypothetical protein
MATIQDIPGSEAPATSRGKINSNFAALNTELALKATSAALASGLAAKADTDHTHGAATTSTPGFMSAADKTKLDGINGSGTPGADGEDGLNGWTAVPAVVSDGARRVIQIVDWTGGTGTKPSVVNQFVGSSGIVSSAAAAVDIRGATGASGSGSGDMAKSVYDTDDDGKVNAAAIADAVPYAGVTGKPSTFPPSTHVHAPRVNTIASAASVTPDVDTQDAIVVTALAENLTVNAPTGTPVSLGKFLLAVTASGGARTVTFNAAFQNPAGSELTNPVTIPSGTETIFAFLYKPATSKYRIVSAIPGF